MSDTIPNMTIITTSQFKAIVTEIKEIKIMLREITKNARKDLLTEKEAKEYLGVSSKTLQKYRNESKIAFSQSGRKIFYKLSDIDDFINKRRIKSFSL